MTEQPLRGAWKLAAERLAALPPLRLLAHEVNVYPVQLLAQLCALSKKRQGAVPDHTLTLVPYLGETALRALVEGQYVERLDDVSYAIHAYLPTDKGLALAASLDEPPKTQRKGR